jgi:serine O-acetyltransferase
MKRQELKQRIYGEILGILDDCIEKTEWSFLGIKRASKIFDPICDEVTEDLVALCEKDPASKNMGEFYFDGGHRSFLAVLHYRIAHHVHHLKSSNKNHCASLAKKISENAKLKTGIEIHPAAIIGKRFVIDHGVGTVIGETCIIGDDCYILENVILGARGIANNPAGKRHPTIGNNAQIGGFARIFGPVTIGDHVFIGPYCVVTDNVPNHTNVVILNQLQFSSGLGQKKLEVYGVFPEDSQSIKIYGDYFSRQTSVSFVDEHHEIISGLRTEIISRSVRCLNVRIVVKAEEISPSKKHGQIILKITNENESVFVTISAVLKKTISTLKTISGANQLAKKLPQ